MSGASFVLAMFVYWRVSAINDRQILIASEFLGLMKEGCQVNRELAAQSVVLAENLQTLAGKLEAEDSSAGVDNVS